MSALTMNPAVPHRKPLPAYSQSTPQPFNDPQPGLHPTTAYPTAQPQYGHSRSRTSSSNVIPAPLHNPNTQQGSMTSQSPYPTYPSSNNRRTLSNATSSTSSSNTSPGLQRQSTNSNYSIASAPRRSTSSRSNSSSTPPTSYVALMRKQKATVWCDRAQHEDPRILAAQRAAKMRAAMEVAGGHNHVTSASRLSSSSSGMVGGVRSKIRHHGAPKASTYNGTMVSGIGVPMRLSATEVDDEDSDDDADSRRHHSRNGSGRSSLASGLRGYSHLVLDDIPSNNSSPSTQSPLEKMNELHEDQTPMPMRDNARDDYFAQPGRRADSGSSGGSLQREENFGSVGGLPHRTKEIKTDEERKKDDDLKRRGSVDDRTMTMGGGRLFVANPDLSD